MRALRRHNQAEVKDVPAADMPVASNMDRIASTPRMTRKWMAAMVLGALLVTLLGIAYQRYGRTDTLVVSRERLTIDTVHQGEFHDFIPLVGTLTPVESVYLDLVEGGQVAEVLTEAGEMVTAGQLLLRLTSTRLDLELLNNEAQLTQQINTLNLTKLQYTNDRLANERNVITVRSELERLQALHRRYEPLAKQGVIARADYEDNERALLHQQELMNSADEALAQSKASGETQIKQMQKTVDDLTARLSVYRKSLDSLNVRAPIAGQLSGFDVVNGQAKPTGARIGQIDKLDQLKVTASVDQYYLSRVKQGELATAEVDGMQYQFKVSKVMPEVQEGLFKIELVFIEAQPTTLRVGQALQLRLEIGSAAQTLLVSNGPFYDSVNDGVLVLDAGGSHATRRKVKLGRRNTEVIEVLSGLNTGEQVVTSSYENYHGINQLLIR
jgi:HlyD family secretion protein